MKRLASLGGFIPCPDHRLMPGSKFELVKYYAEEIKKTPTQGTFVNTPDGPGVVTEIFPLQGEVKVSLRNQSDSAPKRYKRELVELQTRSPRPERPVEDAEDAETESDE